MNDKTVLITGVSGFIAKHCAVELLNAGYRVRGTVRSAGRTAEVKETLAKHADISRLEFAEADRRLGIVAFDESRGVGELAFGIVRLNGDTNPGFSRGTDIELGLADNADGQLRRIDHLSLAGGQRENILAHG